MANPFGADTVDDYGTLSGRSRGFRQRGYLCVVLFHECVVDIFSSGGYSRCVLNTPAQTYPGLLFNRNEM